MLLVQGVDVYGIYKQGNCWKNDNARKDCEVGIAFAPGANRSHEKDPLQLLPPELKQVNF